jgi:hypothetical protein
MAKKTKKPDKTPPSVEQERVALALEYRQMGHDYGPIADAMTEELSEKITVDQVIDWVAKGLAAIHREPTHEQILLDLSRISTLIAKSYENAASGDTQATTMVLALMKRKEELEAKLVPAKPKEQGLFEAIKSDQPNKGGRPAHVPTDVSRAQVEAYVLSGIPKVRIAKFIGISEPTLTKFYDDIITDAKERVKGEAVGTLIQHWRKGDKGMLCFWLKTQCGFRETERLEHSGPDGAPIAMLPDLAKLPLVEFIFTKEAIPQTGGQDSNG